MNNTIKKVGNDFEVTLLSELEEKGEVTVQRRLKGNANKCCGQKPEWSCNDHIYDYFECKNCGQIYWI